MIFVFLGPTLSHQTARAELDAIYLPPVAQGDVYRMALHRPRAIAIIDGYFQQVRSVWHKEILWAMSQGIAVYGAASMGALRAAELADFGMIGVGRVFEDFYSERLVHDDEVAVIHGPAEFGYRSLSEAMVNIRSTLEKAVAEGVSQPSDCARLLELARGLFYPERSYARLLELAEFDCEALRNWLPANKVDQKAEDALALLRRLRTEQPASQTNGFHFEHTNQFENAIRRLGVGSTEGTMLPGERIVEELRLRGLAYLGVSERAILRDNVVRAARSTGQVPSSAEVDRALGHFRTAHQLEDGAELAAWLERNDLSRDQLEALWAEEVLVRQRRGRLEAGGLLSQLRLENDYEDLRQRAEEKELELRQSGLNSGHPEDLGQTVESLLAWYFARVGRSAPADAEGYARTLGFEGAAALVRAVAREFAFLRNSK